MSGLAFFAAADETADEWDQLILNDEVWPGLWEISGDGSQRDVDVKKAPGCDLATVVDKGYKNSKFKFTGTLWEQEHWDELQRILPTLHPRKMGGDRKPLSIIYPALNLLGIESVYVKGISFLQLDKRTQIGTIVIDFIEWEQRPPFVPQGSTTGACGVGVPFEFGTDEEDPNTLAKDLEPLWGADGPGIDEEEIVDEIIRDNVPDFIEGFFTDDPND